MTNINETKIIEIENFDIGDVDTVLSQIVHPEYGTCEDYDWIYSDGQYLGKTKSGIDVYNIEQSGGGEGGAEDCHTILKFGDNAFLRIDYHYQSYNGFDFDYANIYWVRPVTRPVTFYER